MTLVLLIALPLTARTTTDVVVMKNGDHLTGEIKGLNEGVLYLDMEYTGNKLSSMVGWYSYPIRRKRSTSSKASMIGGFALVAVPAEYCVTGAI